MKLLKACRPWIIAVLVGLLLVLVMRPASAQSSECVVDQYNNTVCPPAKTLCLLEPNSRTVKCSPPDGGVLTDRYGNAQCGVGRCVLDIRGDPFCSRDAGGAAARGQYGDAVCTGGCMKAQASLCTTLKK
ncbi:MAG: hypothetical protein V4614_09905 [Pseudomonadota bacterium]